jgi:acyl homoserine lactone synthase
MQLIVVDKEGKARDMALIRAMQRLRAKVFAERLRWQVDCRDGLERDRFDDAGPTYLLLLEEGTQVVGCVRLIAPQRASMLCEVFPQLLEAPGLSLHQRMIESSRFCIDQDLVPAPTGSKTTAPARSLIAERTRYLLTGILEWCLMHGYDEVITATDIRFERLLRIIGWPLQRLGPSILINETESVAGLLSVTTEVFERLKPDTYWPLTNGLPLKHGVAR